MLVKLLSESDGNPSTMRTATLLIVVVILAVEGYAAIHGGTSMKLSVDEIAIMTTALGIKAWQRKIEGQDKPTPEPPAKSG